jgi:hypothetical protein
VYSRVPSGHWDLENVLMAPNNRGMGYGGGAEDTVRG